MMPAIMVVLFLAAYLTTLVVLLTSGHTDNVGGVVLAMLVPLALVLGVGLVRGGRRDD
jgi:hypothetical protein